MTNPFEDAFNNLEAFFQKAAGRFINFEQLFLPKALDLLEAAFEDVLDFAGAAVLDEAPKLISGKEKFGNAVANVIQKVETTGKTVALQTAQAAVQTAFLTAQKVAQGSK